MGSDNIPVRLCCAVLCIQPGRISLQISHSLAVQVQVQQLVHHVTANTDNLTAGIQTCRSTGTLLQNAIVSIQQARTRLGLAGTDASTSLKIAQLYRRNQQLANIMEICSHALMLQQKSADAECVSRVLLVTEQTTNCSWPDLSRAFRRLQ